MLRTAQLERLHSTDVLGVGHGRIYICPYSGSVDFGVCAKARSLNAIGCELYRARALYVWCLTLKNANWVGNCWPICRTG